MPLFLHRILRSQWSPANMPTPSSSKSARHVPPHTAEDEQDPVPSPPWKPFNHSFIHSFLRMKGAKKQTPSHSQLRLVPHRPHRGAHGGVSTDRQVPIGGSPIPRVVNELPVDTGSPQRPTPPARGSQPGTEPEAIVPMPSGSLGGHSLTE